MPECAARRFKFLRSRGREKPCTAIGAGAIASGISLVVATENPHVHHAWPIAVFSQSLAAIRTNPRFAQAYQNRTNPDAIPLETAAAHLSGAGPPFPAPP
jgi:hypothetical protein